MITPVIQEATEAPQPIIPPPSPQRKNRSPLVIALIVVGVLLLPIVLLGAGLIALRAGGEDVSSGVINQVEEFDVRQDLDMEMQVEVLLQSGPTVVLPENAYPGEDRGVQEGSVELVATVTYARWCFRPLPLSGDPVGQRHSADHGLSRPGTRPERFGELPGPDETQPLLFWGTDNGSNGTWYSVAIAGLPMEATRLVTETSNGRFVGSDIVNGVTYQKWPAGEGSTNALCQTVGDSSVKPADGCAGRSRHGRLV